MYSDYNSYDGAALTGGIILIEFIIFAAFYVFYSYTLGLIFKKAGVESWKAWVPVYSSWVLLELGGQAGWIALLSFIPFASIITVIFMIIAVHKINQDFGKDIGYTLLYIFLPFVWCGMLAWGSAKYNNYSAAGMASPQPYISQNPYLTNQQGYASPTPPPPPPIG